MLNFYTLALHGTDRRIRHAEDAIRALPEFHSLQPWVKPPAKARAHVEGLYLVGQGFTKEHLSVDADTTCSVDEGEHGGMWIAAWVFVPRHVYEEDAKSIEDLQ